VTTSSEIRPTGGPAVWNGSSWVPLVDPRPAPPVVARTRTDRRTLAVLLVGVLVLGLSLAALGHLALSRLGVVGAVGVTVVGTVDVADLGTNAHGCQGTGDYADVGTGTLVTLTDGSGELLGTAELGEPVSFGESGCIWTFRVPRVPLDATAYTVALEHGDSTVYPGDVLEADGWTVALSLDR
jgi:hypothetical protein